MIMVVDYRYSWYRDELFNHPIVLGTFLHWLVDPVRVTNNFHRLAALCIPVRSHLLLLLFTPASPDIAQMPHVQLFDLFTSYNWLFFRPLLFLSLLRIWLNQRSKFLHITPLQVAFNQLKLVFLLLYVLPFFLDDPIVSIFDCVLGPSFEQTHHFNPFFYSWILFYFL